MADWKFQALFAENNIDGLEDACLHSRFVEQARQFLTAAENKEAHVGKLNELDEDLVKLFWELHTVNEEVDIEKVEAIKENQASKKMILEMQEELIALREAKDERDRLRIENEELTQLRAEKLEAEKAKKLRAEKLEAIRQEAERQEVERQEVERVEAERQEVERVEAERLEAENKQAPILEVANKKERLLAALAKAAHDDKAIKQTELIEMGVPADKFEAWLSFRYEGYEFNRSVFGTNWFIEK